MAGGTSSETYGSWQNWAVAIFTLVVVTVLNHFGKGIVKLASILIGMVAGYVVSAFFGMVSFSSVASASVFQLPSWVTMIFGKSPVVLATLIAILLNIILPKEES